MTDRLTKNELTWLLAQEARTAAQKLRRGVGMYYGDDLPAPTIMEEGSGGVESTLNRLDEAVSMLASLHGHPIPRGRRGKIDLAALVWEVAPEARVQLDARLGVLIDERADSPGLRPGQVLADDAAGGEAQGDSSDSGSPPGRSSTTTKCAFPSA